MLVRRAAVMVSFLVFVVASFAASPQPVGMLNSAGSDSVAVGGVTVPSGTTLYQGDTIETASGYARFTLNGGAGFVVNPNSKVRLTGAQSVEFVKGMSRLESRGGQLTMIASAWALTPSLDSKTGRVSADVVVEDSGRVSVNVSQGRLTATNRATKEVAVAQLGRPVLLPAAAAPSPAPQAPAGGRGVSRDAKIIGAYVVGVTAAAVGIAAIATRPEKGVSKSDFAASQAQLSQVSSQLSTANTQLTSLAGQLATANTQLTSVAGQLATANALLTSHTTQLATLTSANTALQSQITALNTQITSLRNSLNSVVGYNTQVQALLAQLSAVLAQLQTAQSALASNQNQINALVAQVAQGIPLTAAQQAQLQTLQAQQATLSGQISSLAGQAAALANQIGPLQPPVSAT